MPDCLGKAGPPIQVALFPVNLIVIAAYRKEQYARKTPKSHLHAFRAQAAFSTMLTISAPIASEAVAAGLGAFSTWRAFGRATRQKSW